jgi:hypothetical protein
MKNVILCTNIAWETRITSQRAVDQIPFHYEKLFLKILGTVKNKDLTPFTLSLGVLYEPLVGKCIAAHQHFHPQCDNDHNPSIKSIKKR